MTRDVSQVHEHKSEYILAARLDQAILFLVPLSGESLIAMARLVQKYSF
jgi:hypothetical protein